MSAFSIPAAVGFAGLALLALAMVFAARSYARRTVGVALAGLLAASAGDTAMISQGVYLEADKRLLVADNDRLRIRIRQLELQCGTGSPATCPVVVKDYRLVETERWRRIAFQQSAAVKSQHMGQLTQMLMRKPKVLPGMAVPPPPPPLPTPEQTLANLIDTDSYLWHPVALRGAVTGSGTTYLAKLKIAGKPIDFPARASKLDDLAASQLLESAKALQRNVLALAQNENGVRVYVRGTADARPLTNPASIPETRQLSVLSRGRDRPYGAATQTRAVASPLVNDDLPDLRADWVSHTIGPTLAPVPVAILSNQPADGQGRTVELLVEIDWAKAE